MKTEYLKRVLELVDNGLHLQLAAEKLCITPQGLSMSLSKTESQLGFKIIERNHNHYLRLTGKGAQAVEIMREIVEHAKLLERIKNH